MTTYSITDMSLSSPTLSKQTSLPRSNTDQSTTDGSSSTSTSEITEQFDTFLQLLTAQIQNQDPLAPLDSTQFVDQLATFSSLELQAAGNQTLEEIAAMIAAGAIAPNS